MASLASAIKTASWVVGAAIALASSCSGNVPEVTERVAEGADEDREPIPAEPAEAVVEERPTVLRGPHLVLPAVIDLPYVLAGKGSVTARVPVTNDGDVELTGLAWALTGESSIVVDDAPSSLDPGEEAELTLTWAGSPAEAIVQAGLSVSSARGPEGAADTPVFAVAGDPSLGAAAWEELEGSGNVLAGTGTTVQMPAAPYPDGISFATDASVRVFLPEGYRDRGAQDLVVHFHGWNSTLGTTLARHLYQEHLYASGSNAVLVVPQGPVETASGDFGKLMTRGGLSRLLTEVLVLLYREGRVTHPVRGDLALTAHSGGYQAVVACLDPTNLVPRVAQVNLFDALYGYETLFEGYALGGGFLRSNYTDNGGTFDSNYGMFTYFTQRGLKVATEPTPRALRDDAPVLHFAATSHVGTTRLGGAYGEYLRWKLRHSRRGPRIELREVVARGRTATARWLAPADEDVTGFVVETSPDGAAWTVAARVGPTASEASFALPSILHDGGTEGEDPAGARVRVKAMVKGIELRATLPSDTYRVDAGASVLVVDAFDRVLDGAFGGLHHDFAARVGEAVGPVAGISHRAVTEDGFDLTAWPAVIWLLGDESTADVSLSAAERTALFEYLNGGGHLVMSGSELAFDAGQTADGATFLAHGFGAAYFADDALSHEVAGRGPLAGIGSFTFGGSGAPYAAVSPDTLAVTEGGTVLLEYGSGTAAAVGVRGKGALVGFPLELVAPAALGRVIKGLLAFAGGPAAAPTTPTADLIPPLPPSP